MADTQNTTPATEELPDPFASLTGAAPAVGSEPIPEEPLETSPEDLQAVEEETDVVPAPAAEPTQEDPPVVLEPKVETSAAPVVNEVQEELSPMTDFEESVASIEKTGTMAQKRLVANLKAYVEGMKPGVPMEATDGDRRQYSLWRAIKAVVDDESQSEFKSLWLILLMFFEEYKDGVFGERYVFRFSESWSRKPIELAAFQRTLNLLKVTCNPATREMAKKQIDFNRSLADGFTEAGRGRVLAFYNQ